MKRILLLSFLLQAPVAWAGSAKRVAVIVGANGAAPGRMALRYAHSDARRMAAVLREVGEFGSDDVALLLDPEPQAVLTTLDEAIQKLKGSGGETLLVFYYSGHGDETSLYPSGRALALSELKRRLDSGVATVRLGILDACRGGTWTRTKGLKPAPGLEWEPPFELSTEGSALVASSSGSEDAHEADALGGSFFTHHLVAGLRGAADVSSDQQVSLVEAFTYAREHTVRDSSVFAGAAQNPSFDFNLHGRSDLALARIGKSRSVIRIRQREGPLTLVDLDSGVVLLQTDSGKREFQLALPVGRYLVRRTTPLDLYTYAFSVSSGASGEVDERSLEPVHLARLSSKGPDEVGVLRTSLPSGSWRLRFGALYSDREGPNGGLNGGLSHLKFFGNTLFGITDRLQWSFPLPAFTYRIGQRGEVETLIYGGLTDLQPSSSGGEFGADFSYVGGTGVRLWSTSERSINAALTMDSVVSLFPNPAWPKTWRLSGSVGFSRAFTSQFAVNLGIRLSDTVIRNGKVGTRASPDESDPAIALGSVQSLGLYSLPLVRFQVTDTFYFDGYSSVSYRLKTREFNVTIGAGGSWELL
ncbi:MAG: caspase family protein [Myxococcaceae bacterium]